MTEFPVQVFVERAIYRTGREIIVLRGLYLTSTEYKNYLDQKDVLEYLFKIYKIKTGDKFGDFLCGYDKRCYGVKCEITHKPENCIMWYAEQDNIGLVKYMLAKCRESIPSMLHELIVKTIKHHNNHVTKFAAKKLTTNYSYHGYYRTSDNFASLLEHAYNCSNFEMCEYLLLNIMQLIVSDRHCIYENIIKNNNLEIWLLIMCNFKRYGTIVSNKICYIIGYYGNIQFVDSIINSNHYKKHVNALAVGATMGGQTHVLDHLKDIIKKKWTYYLIKCALYMLPRYNQASLNETARCVVAEYLYKNYTSSFLDISENTHKSIINFYIKKNIPFTVNKAIINALIAENYELLSQIIKNFNLHKRILCLIIVILSSWFNCKQRGVVTNTIETVLEEALKKLYNKDTNEIKNCMISMCKYVMVEMQSIKYNTNSNTINVKLVRCPNIFNVESNTHNDSNIDSICNTGNILEKILTTLRDY
jgi:hypothetical protein